MGTIKITSPGRMCSKRSHLSLGVTVIVPSSARDFHSNCINGLLYLKKISFEGYCGGFMSIILILNCVNVIINEYNSC